MPSDAAATTAEDAYWSREASALLDELGSGSGGLDQREAAERLKRYGANAVAENGHVASLRLLGRQFASPLVVILLIGAVLSGVVGDWLDAGIILAIVLGSTALGFTQEYRASEAVRQLRQRLDLRVQVVRNGSVRSVPARELVPGDIVQLAAGNLVPADGLVLQARDFLVSEAGITGESMPVEKQPGVVRPEAALAQRTNCAYAGTSVRSGNGTLLVIRTGARTLYGEIASRLRTNRGETTFAAGVRQFGYLLVRVTVVMVFFVLAVNEALGRPMIESLLFAVALAVGISPELLPAIVSVTLARGARAMASQGVIVRRLEAIEDLGSIDVLCTDKTGTLTSGTMSLQSAVDAAGNVSSDVLRWAYENASFETGIENPLDAAIVRAGEAAGIDLAACEKIDEIPYDFVRKRLTIVLRDDSVAGEHRIVTKGAFSNVLDVCTRVRDGRHDMPLDDEYRARLREYFRGRGEAGYRVLGVAVRSVDAQQAYGHQDEAQMTFVGFLLFLDPPKSDAARAIRDLAARGIRVKLVTGDNRYVAAHIGALMGLDTSLMLTGEAIAELRDEALWHLAERTALFVEVDPQQKERIVLALQRVGRSVAFLGDGINDAPALHAADVGISVEGAADVARESADVVLLRADLGVLCRGVDDGRRTFANTLKYICITSSANFGNMVSMAIATPLLPFLPLTATQILLNNFLSDLPSLAISTDNVDQETVARAQAWDIREVRHFMIWFGLLSTAFDLLTFHLLLNVFQADKSLFQTVWFVVSLLTELTVLLVLRTRRPTWRSGPSRLLISTTVLVAIVALTLPYIAPVATLFGMVPPPLAMLAAIAAVILGYLAATEALKAHMRG